MDESTSPLHEPWLVAAWPGMGHVGVGAVAYLMEELGATLTHELAADDIFDVNHVVVKGGIARPAARPRCLVFESKGEAGRRDLLFFLAESQPPAGGFMLCQRLMDYAVQRGVTNVYTFAAMATQMHPTAKPRVFGAATDATLLPALREYEVEILQDGQIGGLNGLLLAAAADREVPGVCLLGELPYFAAGVQNPRASRAVLEMFTKRAGVTIDFSRIRSAGDEMEPVLEAMLEKLEQAEAPGDVESFESASEFEPPSNEEPPPPKRPALAPADRRRIERLFDEAQADRSQAFALKAELDRLNAFADFEDRFLDLFKRGE